MLCEASAKQGYIIEGHAGKLKYVYLLRSIVHPERRYVGITSDLSRRLEEHEEDLQPLLEDQIIVMAKE